MEKKIDIKRHLRQVLQDVKFKCKEDCCAGDRESWLNCSIKNCTLYKHRFGNVRKKNVNLTKEKQHNFEKNAISEEVAYEKGVEDETKINE